MDRNTRKFSCLVHPYVMLCLAPLIWSTSNVTAKLAVGLLTPYQFTFYRWLLATLILSLCFSRRIRTDWQALAARKWWLLCWGGSAFCLFNILLYSAFQAGAKAVNVGIIHSLIPIMVITFGVSWYREKTHVLQWVGILCALFGVLFLLTGGHPVQLLHWRPVPADSLNLATALIYAVYSLALRRAPSVHWASLMWAMCVGALIVATPFWFHELVSGGQWHWVQPLYPTPEQILNAVLILLYVAVFVAIVSKMFYMEGTIALGGSRSSLVMNLLPPFNALMALLVFGDERASFGSVQAVALGFVLIGIVASEIGALRKQRQPGGRLAGAKG